MESKVHSTPPAQDRQCTAEGDAVCAVCSKNLTSRKKQLGGAYLQKLVAILNVTHDFRQQPMMDETLTSIFTVVRSWQGEEEQLHIKVAGRKPLCSRAQCFYKILEKLPEVNELTEELICDRFFNIGEQVLTPRCFVCKLDARGSGSKRRRLPRRCGAWHNHIYALHSGVGASVPLIVPDMDTPICQICYMVFYNKFLKGHRQHEAQQKSLQGQADAACSGGTCGGGGDGGGDGGSDHGGGAPKEIPEELAEQVPVTVLYQIVRGGRVGEEVSLGLQEKPGRRYRVRLSVVKRQLQEAVLLKLMECSIIKVGDVRVWYKQLRENLHMKAVSDHYLQAYVDTILAELCALSHMKRMVLEGGEVRELKRGEVGSGDNLLLALNGANGPPLLNANTWLKKESDSRVELMDLKQQPEQVTAQLGVMMKERQLKDNESMVGVMVIQCALLLRLEMQHHSRELKRSHVPPYIDVSLGGEAFTPNAVGGLSFEDASGDKVRAEMFERFSNYPETCRQFLCTFVTGKSGTVADSQTWSGRKGMAQFSRIFHLTQSMMKAVNGKRYKPELGLMTAQFIRRNKGQFNNARSVCRCGLDLVLIAQAVFICGG
jgi:hypothetical protein